MRSLRPIALFAALAAAVVVGPAVQAETVIFGTTGTFAASGTSTLDLGGGNIIVFEGSNLDFVNANPTSQATFGQFDTSQFLDPSSVSISTGFTLVIEQLSPTPTGNSEITFLGSISGTLSVDSSGLFLLFDGPLTDRIQSALHFVDYSIVSADRGVMGRININPSTTLGGRSTISGEITVTPIPEPSTVVLAGLATPAVLVYGLRRRKVASV